MLIEHIKFTMQSLIIIFLKKELNWPDLLLNGESALLHFCTNILLSDYNKVILKNLGQQLFKNLISFNSKIF